ncbi:MAG: PTS transporter subunit EIIC [Tissierellaceae bacterium]
MSRLENNQRTKSKFPQNIFDILGSIFGPIISIIIGAGILQALRDILLTLGVIEQVSSSYIFLNAMGDAVFYFLPIFLAFSAARVFGASPYMAASVAAFLVYPSITELFEWAQSVGWNLTLFGVIPVTYSKYPSSVLPIILIVWIQSYLEKGVDRIIPSLLKPVFVPVLTLFGTAFMGLTILGPIGTWLGNLLAAGLGLLNTHVAWLVPTLVGAFAPFMVLTGSHYSLFPLATQNLAQLGYDTVLLPGNMASNLALAGCSLAISLRTKSKMYKSFSASAGVTAIFGISQSSLYGIAIPLKKPLYAAMLAGGGAGFFAGITQIKCYSFVTPGVLSLVGYFSDKEPLSNLIYAILTCVIAFVAGFILTLVLGFEDPDDEAVSQLSGK